MPSSPATRATLRASTRHCHAWSFSLGDPTQKGRSVRSAVLDGVNGARIQPEGHRPRPPGTSLRVSGAVLGRVQLSAARSRLKLVDRPEGAAADGASASPSLRGYHSCSAADTRSVAPIGRQETRAAILALQDTPECRTPNWYASGRWCVSAASSTDQPFPRACSAGWFGHMAISRRSRPDGCRQRRCSTSASVRSMWLGTGSVGADRFALVRGRTLARVAEVIGRVFRGPGPRPTPARTRGTGGWQSAPRPDACPRSGGAAVDPDVLRGDPAGLVAGQEGDDGCDLAGLAEPAE